MIAWKSVLLWKLKEPDKEIGPGENGSRLWTRIWMICIKLSDAVEEMEEND